MKTKFVTCLLILSLLLSCISCGLLSNSLEDFFAEWEIENVSDVAIVNPREGLLLDEKLIDIFSLLDEYHPNSVSNDTLLVESNGKIYGTHSYDYENELYYQSIDIFSFDLTTHELKVLHSKNYCPRDKTNCYETLIYAKECYSKRNIMIYDGTVVTVFNIDEETVNYLSPESFTQREEDFSFQKVYDKNGKQNFKEIRVVDNNEERVINIEYMAQRHKYVQQLLEKFGHKTIFETLDPLSRFFKNQFVINHQIYFECVVFDIDGEQNTLLFAYDYTEDTFKFVYHTFTTDPSDFFLIPRE